MEEYHCWQIQITMLVACKWKSVITHGRTICPSPEWIFTMSCTVQKITLHEIKILWPFKYFQPWKTPPESRRCFDLVTLRLGFCLSVAPCLYFSSRIKTTFLIIQNPVLKLSLAPDILLVIRQHFNVLRTLFSEKYVPFIHRNLCHRNTNFNSHYF